jgi:antitoxin component of RelBE/YafQ-DinJ toxin-antitoxin module
MYICGMDAKITLSFNEAVIKQAKEYAEANNISLSRMIEFLLQKITSSNYQSLEEFPISNWVQQIAEGEAVYQTKPRSRKSAKEEFYKSKK